MTLRALAYAALLCAMPVAASAAITVTSGTPAGFSELAAPHSTVVTLTYGGELLGHFPAHYTASYLKFDAPAEIIALIPAITHREAVLAALSIPLAHHADQLCRNGQSTDCGTLTPEDAAVIFNEATLSAELFIHPRHLGVRDSNGPRYLPLPARELSSVVGVSGAASGTTGERTSYVLSTNSILAYGEARFNSQSSVTNEGLRFDTAAAGIDRNGWEALAGLFRSRALQLVADRDMAGISVGTSMRTRLDARKIAGNDIVLYLPRRAIVSIYREGRVVSSRAYEAGNQNIDTSELPEGAYPIKLMIQESGGSAREETRFFAKSPDIPPPGEPTYYAQAGVLRAPPEQDSTAPTLTSKPIMRLGTVQRVDDNLGLTSDLIWLDDRAAVEGGGFLLHGDTQIRATALGSTSGDVGAQFSCLKTSGRWGLAADARALWGDDSAATLTNADAAITSFKQATANVTYVATPNLTLGGRASISDQFGMHHTAYGPNLSWYLWREAENMLSFDADAGRSDDQFVGNALLRFTFRFGEYGASGSGGYAANNGLSGAVGSGRIWRDHATDDGNLLIGAGAQYDRSARTVGADGDWRNSFGRVRGLLQQGWGDRGTTTSYGSNFSFNSAQVEDGIYLGGDHSDMSAVIVTLSGNADVPMNIMVGGVARGVVNPGESQTVYLAPYQQYQLRLSPLRSTPLEYDTQARRVTLYPGNVAHMAWTVNKVYIVLTQLVDTQGAPIAGAWLQEGDGRAITNAKGWLQVQLSDPARLTFITSDLQACEASLPAATPVNGVLMYKKPLTCEPIPLS